MYTDRNFKTKKELKTAVEAYNTIKGIDGERAGRAVTYHQPGPFGGNEPRDGSFCVEGPHTRNHIVGMQAVSPRMASSSRSNEGGNNVYR